MMLVIGNPTNVYLATSAGIGFIDYFKVMALPTLSAGAVEFVVISLLFFKSLKKSVTLTPDDFTLKNKTDVIIGVIHLSVCLLLLVLSDFIGISMWLASFFCALSLFICVLMERVFKKGEWREFFTAVKRLPWQLIPFVLSMFVIVVALEYQGISQKIGEFLGQEHCIWTYGGASFIAANLINNIPMSMLFATFPAGLNGSAYFGAVYATIVGSNIGAFLTPIGALAGIMFSSLTEKNGVKYGFKEFIKYGIVVSVPTIFAVLITLQAIL